MTNDITSRLAQQYRHHVDETEIALAEVLCSAYKDATGVYPDDHLREKIIEALRGYAK